MRWKPGPLVESSRAPPCNLKSRGCLIKQRTPLNWSACLQHHSQSHLLCSRHQHDLQKTYMTKTQGRINIHRVKSKPGYRYASLLQPLPIIHLLLSCAAIQRRERRPAGPSRPKQEDHSPLFLGCKGMMSNVLWAWLVRGILQGQSAQWVGVAGKKARNWWEVVFYRCSKGE